MEWNTNNISSAGLHGLDQRQYRSGTSEEVDVRHGQNALGAIYRFDAARLWLVVVIVSDINDIVRKAIPHIYDTITEKNSSVVRIYISLRVTFYYCLF